jgi:hypothetical protein
MGEQASVRYAETRAAIEASRAMMAAHRALHNRKKTQ